MFQNKNKSSFRDPSGFIFSHEGVLSRYVSMSYKDNYDALMTSGLYKNLTEANLLVSHFEKAVDGGSTHNGVYGAAYKIIQPEFISFISYPYEWSFSQLKDAALLTLEIQERALKFGLSLKDASAYNVQFQNGRPIFIDTLSFEKYEDNHPWVAYRQFCQHFLAPLALMAFKDIRLGQFLRIFIDGIPLDLTSSLLSPLTYLKPGLLSHIHLHSRSQKAFGGKAISGKKYSISKFSLLAIIDSLKTTVTNISWRRGSTEWADYYEITNYDSDTFQEKKNIIKEFIGKIKPRNIWDLGANNGLFSRLASDQGVPVVAFDIDSSAVEENYLIVKNHAERHILPLVLDLTNPSSGIGWHGCERQSFFERGPADTVFALALIHHLVISNNLPFEKVADFLADICKHLIIEFVPKDDSQVQRLLVSRKDIFHDYNREKFESTFSHRFTVLESRDIPGSKRVLYLMALKKLGH